MIPQYKLPLLRLLLLIFLLLPNHLGAQNSPDIPDNQSRKPFRIVKIDCAYNLVSKKTIIRTVSADYVFEMPNEASAVYFQPQYLTVSGHWVDGLMAVYGSTDEITPSNICNCSVYFRTNENGIKFRIIRLKDGQLMSSYSAPLITAKITPKPIILMSPSPSLRFEFLQPVLGASVAYSLDNLAWSFIPTGLGGPVINVGDIWRNGPGKIIYCQIEWAYGLTFYKAKYILYPNHEIKEIIPTEVIVLNTVLDEMSRKEKLKQFLKAHPQFARP